MAKQNMKGGADFASGAAAGGQALMKIMTLVGRVAFILFVVILFSQRISPSFMNFLATIDLRALLIFNSSL